MKSNKSLSVAPVPLWQRITAYINIFLLMFYALLPGSVAAYEAVSNGFIETELNGNPQFQLSANNRYIAEKAYYVTDTTSVSTQTIESFHARLLEHRKESLPNPLMIPIINGGITIIIPHYPLGKQIGDSFVQARFIRSQIFNQLNRNLLRGGEDNEAAQINVLYNRAFDFSANSSKRFGDKLTRTDVNQFGDNLIWPEYRDINGQKVLVPVVHLTDATIDDQLVDSHVVELSGSESNFNNITINAGTLNTRRSSLLNVAGNLSLAEGAALKASHDLNVMVGGTLQNISGQISAVENVDIIARQYLQKTVVHRYQTPFSQSTRLGEIASVDAGGNILIRTAGDLVVNGGTVSGNNIIFHADGDIVLQSQRSTFNRNEEVGGWNESESVIQQYHSQLTAAHSIQLMAAGAIEINTTNLYADQGTINILAGQGVYILDSNNQFQSQRSGKFGRTTIQEQEFQTIAMRSALEAGRGIVIATELGDINLRGAQLTSTTGTEINALNGAVNFLLTKEQKDYFYQKVVKGFWKIKTTTQQDNVETAVYNEIIGGVKVNATHGMTLELGQYEDGDVATGINTETSRISKLIQDKKDEIAFNQSLGVPQSTIDALEADLAKLGQELLNEQLAQLAQTDSLAWMQTLHNDPEYQENFNIVYQELVELHKFEKTSTLSPAAMAIIAIAVAVALGPAGYGAIGAEGAISVSASAAISEATAAALTASLQAGVVSITTQAATSLANGQGIEGTVKSLYRSDSIRATVTAMLTAGVLAYVDDITLFGEATHGTEVSAIANQSVQLIRDSAIRAGISTVVNGGDFRDFKGQFVHSLQSSAIDKLGQELSSSIETHSGDLGVALEYVAHAATGCLVGSLTSDVNNDDEQEGCVAGAGGAVIANAIANSYDHELDKLSTNGENVADMLGKDLNIADTDPSSYSSLIDEGYIDSAHYIQARYVNSRQSIIRRYQASGADMSRLAAGLAAFIAGGSANAINIAADSAGNAATASLWRNVTPSVRNAIGLYNDIVQSNSFRTISQTPISAYTALDRGIIPQELFDANPIRFFSGAEIGLFIGLNLLTENHSTLINDVASSDDYNDYILIASLSEQGFYNELRRDPDTTPSELFLYLIDRVNEPDLNDVANIESFRAELRSTYDNWRINYGELFDGLEIVNHNLRFRVALDGLEQGVRSIRAIEEEARRIKDFFTTHRESSNIVRAVAEKFKKALRGDLQDSNFRQAIKDNPQLLEAWKKLHEQGASQAARRNITNLEQRGLIDQYADNIATASDQRKGNFGEIGMDLDLNTKGYTSLQTRIKNIDEGGHHGVDGVYVKDGQYFIVEGKYAGSASINPANPNTGLPRQMSDEWLVYKDNLINAVGPDRASVIMRQGYERVLAKVASDGTVRYQLIDTRGYVVPINQGGQWTP